MYVVYFLLGLVGVAMLGDSLNAIVPAVGLYLLCCGVAGSIINYLSPDKN